MPWVAISFLVAALLVVALSFLTKGRRHPSFRLSLMLLAFWGLANVTDPWIDPWVDAAGFYAALLVRMDHRSRWVEVLGAAFFLQLITHMTLFDLPRSRQVTLNVLFAVELLAVALPGMIDVLESSLRRLGVPLDHPRPVGLRRRSQG